MAKPPRKVAQDFVYELFLVIIAQIVLQAIGFAIIYFANQSSNLGVIFIAVVVFGIIGLVIGILLIRRYVKRPLEGRELPTTTPQTPQPIQVNERLKGIEIVRNTEELIPLSTLFSGVEKRVIILAMDAGILTKKNYPIFRNLLDKGETGVIVHLYLIDPRAKAILKEISRVWPIVDAEDSLRETLKRLRGLRNELSEKKRSNLKITFFDLLPIHSLIIVDPESANPKMHVTGYQYNSHDWMSLDFSKNDQEGLYDRYWASLQYVENHKTREWDFEESSF